MQARAAAFDRRSLAALLEAFPTPAASTAALDGYRRHYGLPEPASAPHEIGRVEVRGEDVVVQRFSAREPRGTLVCVHGLFEHGALWRHQVSWGLDRGLDVVLIDLPGHGLSAGERAHVHDFTHYVEAFEAAVAAVAPHGPILALGHSTGAAVLMQAIVDGGSGAARIDELVLLGPLVRPARHRLVRLLLPVASLFVLSLPRNQYSSSSDPAYNRFQAQQDPLQPRRLPLAWVRAMRAWFKAFEAGPQHHLSPLIIQGNRDSVVDWRSNLGRIRRRFTEPEVVMLEGARHNLPNEASAYRARIEAALDIRLRRMRASFAVEGFHAPR